MSSPVAVVTGASRGIGKQLCVDLAKAGYDVVCAARSSAEQPSKLPGTIEETAALVEAEGRVAMPVALDVRDDEAVAELADRVFARFGRCDLLVNNAAVAVPGPALQDSLRHWRLGVDVNINGPFYMMHAFCPRMAEGSRVVNVSSMAAETPDFGRPSYTATKAGLEAMSLSLAYELQGRIAVNCLRIDLMVWSEGFAFTLEGEDAPDFEDPVIISDALLWMAAQPLSYTGDVTTVTELRDRGVVRPFCLKETEG